MIPRDPRRLAPDDQAAAEALPQASDGRHPVLTLLPLIALPGALILAGLALCSAHIPGLRRLTGAAPLVREPDEAADFARTIHDGHMETPEQFAARVGLDRTETPGEGS